MWKSIWEWWRVRRVKRDRVMHRLACEMWKHQDKLSPELRRERLQLQGTVQATELQAGSISQAGDEATRNKVVPR